MGLLRDVKRHYPGRQEHAEDDQDQYSTHVDQELRSCEEVRCQVRIERRNAQECEQQRECAIDHPFVEYDHDG